MANELVQADLDRYNRLKEERETAATAFQAAREQLRLADLAFEGMLTIMEQELEDFDSTADSIDEAGAVVKDGLPENVKRLRQRRRERLRASV